MTESVGQSIAISQSSSRPSFGLTDLLLLAMATIWGINFVVVKYATRSFNPLAFAGLRVALVALFLMIVAFARDRNGGGETPTRRSLLQRVDRKDLLRLLLAGMIGNGLYQLFFVLGV